MGKGVSLASASDGAKWIHKRKPNCIGPSFALKNESLEIMKKWGSSMGGKERHWTGNCLHLSLVGAEREKPRGPRANSAATGTLGSRAMS